MKANLPAVMRENPAAAMAAGWPSSEWAPDLNKSGDLLALLPQAPRGRIVPRGGARLDLAAIIEIAAADIGELRQTREMDDGVRAGLVRTGEDRRSPQDPPRTGRRHAAPSLSRRIRGEAIRSDAGARELARKPAGE